MNRTAAVPLLCLMGLFACDGEGTPETDAPIEVETLEPEPAGAPTDVVDGRTGCLDTYVIGAPAGTALELTGYVRTLADPTATSEPPPATVEVFDASGSSLGEAFSDPTRTGRTSVSVPVASDGFTGYAEIEATGYLPERFSVSVPIADTAASAWVFLATSGERDQIAGDLGVATGDADAILVGSVHDCDGFGAGNVVVTLDRSADGVFYVEGFAPTAARTFTSSTGRFALGGLAPGSTRVEAWGRLEAGGPLSLLGAIDATLEAGVITAVSLEPRPAPG